MNHRLKRVEEAIKRELGQIIARDMSFGESLPTIHDVSVSPDLRNCHVYLGVLGPQRTAEDVLGKLRDASGMLQVALAKRVILKYTPHLHFHLDSSVERGVRILQILDDIPPFLEDEQPGTAPEAEFDTDSADEDLMEDNDFDDEDEEEGEEDEDEPTSSQPTAAPERKRASRSRQNRVDPADL